MSKTCSRWLIYISMLLACVEAKRCLPRLLAFDVPAGLLFPWDGMRSPSRFQRVLTSFRRPPTRSVPSPSRRRSLRCRQCQRKTPALHLMLFASPNAGGWRLRRESRCITSTRRGQNQATSMDAFSLFRQRKRVLRSWCSSFFITHSTATRNPLSLTAFDHIVDDHNIINNSTRQLLATLTASGPVF